MSFKKALYTPVLIKLNSMFMLNLSDADTELLGIADRLMGELFEEAERTQDTFSECELTMWADVCVCLESLERRTKCACCGHLNPKMGVYRCKLQSSTQASTRH